MNKSYKLSVISSAILASIYFTDFAFAVGVNTNAQPITSDVNQPIVGMADIHNHMLAKAGFGRNLFAGRVIETPGGGLDTALGKCNNVHGWLGVDDTVGNILRGSYPAGHDVEGNGRFDGWPKWNSYNHQTMYHKWLERAFLGGLRLLVVHAVSNEVLCDVRNDIDACDDMEAVSRQISNAKFVESFIDKLDDQLENDSGWFKIVRSPREAREAIANGRLAVVLGIEVDDLFGCRENGGCSDLHISKQLNKWYHEGVRHLFPVHVFNNEFGGAAAYNVFFNQGNKLFNDRFLDLQDCSSEGFSWNANSSYNEETFVAELLFKEFPGKLNPPTYSGSAHCNKKGLTSKGKQLIEELMNAGMVIDIDHMSREMLDEVFDIMELADYPVVSGHGSPAALFNDGYSAEGSRTDSDLKRIHDLGGMTSINLSAKETEQIKDDVNGIPFKCSKSVEGWAQMYTYSLKQVQEAASDDDMLVSVGMSTDFNGLIEMTAPRKGNRGLGTEPCDGKKTYAEQADEPDVQYPFKGRAPYTGNFFRQQTGSRSFDINKDGLAHVGLLPDLIRELEVIGMSEEQIAPIFNSAEKYVQVWEKSYTYGLNIPFTKLFSVPSSLNGWLKEEQVELYFLTQLTGEELTHLNLIIDGPGGYSKTELSTKQHEHLISDEGITSIQFHSEYDYYNKAETPKNVTIKIDKYPPMLDLVMSTPANSNGWYNQEVDVLLNGSDSGSGIYGYHYQINDEVYFTKNSSFSLTHDGIYEITAWAEDVSGKISDKKILTVKVDQTPPELNCSIYPDVIWPPNKKVIDVEISIEPQDSLSGIEKSWLVAYDSSDQVSNVVFDFVLQTDDRNGGVIADRQKIERLYRFHYQTQDVAGNQSEVCNVTTTVPLSQGEISNE